MVGHSPYTVRVCLALLLINALSHNAVLLHAANATVLNFDVCFALNTQLKDPFSGLMYAYELRVPFILPTMKSRRTYNPGRDEDVPWYHVFDVRTLSVRPNTGLPVRHAAHAVRSLRAVPGPARLSSTVPQRVRNAAGA